MGSVADTSLRALEKEIAYLRFPPWLQRFLFFRKAKGTHGVHSPLAYQLATTVFTKPGDSPIADRLRTHFPEITLQTADVSQLPEALHFLTEKAHSALWITHTQANRALWLRACGDNRVTLAIDCFDCGLLLHTPEVKEKQYLRQRSTA